MAFRIEGQRIVDHELTEGGVAAAATINRPWDAASSKHADSRTFVGSGRGRLRDQRLEADEPPRVN
jgi:hypothetical protein